MSTTSHQTEHAPREQDKSSNEDDEEVSDAAKSLFDRIAHHDRTCYNCFRPKLRSHELTEWTDSGAPPAARARVCSRCGTGRPGDERPGGGFAAREWGRDRPLAARGSGEYTVTTILQRALARLSELFGVDVPSAAADAAFDRALSLKTDEGCESKDREVLAAGVYEAVTAAGYEVRQDGTLAEEQEQGRVAAAAGGGGPA